MDVLVLGLFFVGVYLSMFLFGVKLYDWTK